MEYPLVSIIVPVYNNEKYIERCLNSILNQTYTNIQIIVINDGSTDNSYKICKKYAEQDNRIFLISQKNSGVSSARNTGLKEAKGEVLSFIDSDDWVHERFIEDNLKIMIEKNADMICFNLQEIYSDNIIDVCQFKENMTTEDIQKGLILDELSCYMWNKIYKKSLWKNKQFPVGMIFEDFFIMASLVLDSNKIAVNESIYYYYDKSNDKSYTNRYNLNFKYDFFKGFKERVKLLYKKQDFLYKECIKRMLKNALRAYNDNIYVHNLNIRQVQELDQCFREYYDYKNLLDFKYRIFLWVYFHCNLINKYKGLEFYFNAKRNSWIN